MNQATSFGTVFLYGITGRITNGAVQSFKGNNETKNNATTDNENGDEIERRYSDNHYEGTIEFKYRSTYAIPAVASILVYEGVSWEVVKVARNEAGKTHRILSLDIKRSENIDSTTSTPITLS